MLDKLIIGLEGAQEHEHRCGYISVSLELRDDILKVLKGFNNKSSKNNKSKENKDATQEGMS